MYIVKTFFFYNLARHGTTKLVTGLGLLGIGALTGNQAVTDTGSALTTLGIGTNIAAHFLGWNKIISKPISMFSKFHFLSNFCNILINYLI